MKKEGKVQKNKKLIILITVMALIGIIVGSILIRNVVVNQGTEGEKYLEGGNASSSLIANNIKKGITIGGITGTLEDLNTFDATATSEDILEGKTAYVKGEKIIGTYVKDVLVTEISLSESEVTLRAGEKFKLTATAIPKNATNKSVIWSSSNSECASVDQLGIITAVNIGNCTITVQAAGNGGIKSTCNVTVIPVIPGSITFAIEISEMEFGYVVLSLERAKEGDEVKIYVMPDGGYRLESISVVDRNGDNIEVTGDGSGVYTFVMPESNVSVAATFVPL